MRRRWVLTAHFHAAERRGLRHWLAALRERCGPGPPRHDDPTIPTAVTLAWVGAGLGRLGGLLRGRTRRLLAAKPSHPK